MLVVSAFGQKNLTLLGFKAYADELNDIWGYVDDSNREYALVGTVNGTSIVDVTDPGNPVELHFVTGANSTWRDIKVWNKHAYVTNETSGGLQIIDLTQLPGTINTTAKTFRNSITGVDSLHSAHNLFIDENGYAYIFGYNNSVESIVTENRGALILNLNGNPKDPQIVGIYNKEYVHDGFVRNDTMWASEIYSGNFAVVDVSNKSNPVLMALQTTPNRFTHNCWLSDDGNTLFTTDERTTAYITSYNVRDLGNIKELDRYQTSPGTGLIPHNTIVYSNYLVNSYYRDGVTIVDATKPDNLVEVGKFDTSPFIPGDGFEGCWGIYPFLPSGNIIASDTEEGLFILDPNYTRACYLEGKVTTDLAPNGLSTVRVEFLETGYFKFSNSVGNYKTGVADAGLYTVRFFKNGCQTKIISGVQLQSGQTTTLDVEMNCSTVGIADTDYSMLSFEADNTIFADRVNLSVYNNTGFEESTLRVYNLNGTLIESYLVNTPKASFQLGSNWAKGIYIAEITASNSQKTIKVVKAQ